VSLAWVLARRELRAGVRGLRLVFACLALGVAAVAAVGSLRAGLDATLAQDGRALLGGDLEVQGGSQPIPLSVRDWLRGRGARLSDVVTLRSMLAAPSGTRALVELKAVDGAWPLVGAPELSTPQPLASALDGGVLVDPSLLARLGVRPGAVLRLGDARLVLRGTMRAVPDQAADPAIFGAPALIGLPALAASHLLQPSALTEHRLRAVLAPGSDVRAILAALRAVVAGSGLRVRDTSQAAPGVRRFIDQTALFFTLVGLTALLVGGIGVAGGVRAWITARAATIATLRCLGAEARLVFQVCLIEVAMLCAAAIVAGLLAGALLPLTARLLPSLPILPASGPFWAPLLLAASCGALVALAFALPPLGRAMQVPGAALFRAEAPVGATPGGRVPWRLALASAATSVLLAALVVASAPDRRFALGFCVAAAATLALFRLAGVALVAVAARLPRPRRFAPRLGLAALHRPGSAAPALLVSVGLGLSTLAAVALIEGNLRAQFAAQLPQAAPSFFFIDIQPAQVAPFRAILTATPGVAPPEIAPSLRARLLSVDGVPAEQVRATPETRWALSGDRGLTIAATPPPGTRLVAGQWWPQDYAGPPLVSFDAGLARGWGIGVGSTLRVNVLGRDIDLRIASLRDIDWRGLGLNFAMVASPGLLSHAPYSDIATVRAAPASQAMLLRRVTDALPNVTGIRVADILDAVARLLGQLAAALAASGGLTLAAGALVLAGAVAGSQQRRIREAVILKVLGATHGQIRAAWLVEFGILGGVAGVLAAAVGSAASFCVMRFVLHAQWLPLPGRLAATILACAGLTLVLGFAGTEAALRARAAPLLRSA
jgi:putative ABC transport system permease protein